MSTQNKKPDAADVHVGRKVHERRRAVGLSQEKLGEQLGITFQQVQKYENGSNRISAGRLFYISEALGTPIDYFFGGLREGDRQAGFAEGGGQPELAGTPRPDSEVEQLVRDFRTIDDPRVRRSLLDFVRSLAEPASATPGRKRRLG